MGEFFWVVFLCCCLGPERVWPEGAVMIREREGQEDIDVVQLQA